MSEIKVNKITPRAACGTTQLGDSGDTFTIPSGATITNSGTASGFGATGETSWDTTVKTTGTFTATAGVGYFLNTTGGTITVNLPVGAAGSSVALADYAGTWDTNAVTVNANGTEKIGGVASAPATLSTEGQSVTFVYIDGTQGWVNVLDSTSNIRGNAYMTATVSGACNTLTTVCSNYKLATFKGPGTFCVSCAAQCAAENLVSYVVVAGGGAGGYGGYPYSSTHLAGAGGAGGYRELVSPASPYTGSPTEGYPTPGNRITVSATGYPIVVGGGGSLPPGATSPGGDGSDSTAFGLTSTGGGGGGGGDAGGNTGGSGGGGGSGPCTPQGGGAGNTPPITPAQGFAGGSGDHSPGGARAGGGGGATTVGQNGTGGPYPVSCSPKFGVGGTGAPTQITGSPAYYAGGGGGSSNCCSVPIDSRKGGDGGGGAGATNGDEIAVAGTVNTGGGGGAGSSNTAPYSIGGLGGSGVVYIRYRFQ